MARTLPTRARRSARLSLRPFRRRDLDALVEAVHESLPDLQAWLPWAHDAYARADAIRFLRDSAAAWGDGRAFDFTIKRRGDGVRHLGNVSVWPTSRREQAGEVGYWIRSSEVATGIATEAAARVLQVGFEELGLHRIILRIAVGNRPSERVAEKLGFVQEGVLRKEVFVGGEWVDHSLWGLLDEEFRARRETYVASGWLQPA